MKTVAIIGLGNISTRHRRNLKALYPGCRIVALPASGKAPAHLPDNVDVLVTTIDEMVACHPDIAIVASPAPLHASHAVTLLAHHIPVLIEKPLTATSEDAARLVEAAQAATVPALVGYCLRYLPSAQAVKALLDEGAIGTVYNVWSEVGQFLPDWRPKDHLQSVSASVELGGGALLELSHELDYLQWFFGELTPMHGVLRNTVELALPVEEIVDVTLRTATGVVCHVHLDFIQKKPRRTCSIMGSTGRIDWDLGGNTVTLHTANASRIVYEDVAWDKNGMYLALVRDFVAVVNGAKQIADSVACQPDAAAQTIRLIDHIKQHAVGRNVA